MHGRDVGTAVRLDHLIGRGNRGVGQTDKLNGAAVRRSQTKAWWLRGVLAGSIAVLVIGCIHPVAAFDLRLRAAAETVVVVCAATVSLILHWRFARTHLLRDLLLMVAVLSAGLLDLTAYLLPGALKLQSIGASAGAIPFGLLLVAAVFVAAARVPSDRFVTRARLAEVVAISLSTIGVLLAVTVALLWHYSLGRSSAAAVYGLRAALTHPLTLVLALAASAVFANAAGAFLRRERKEYPGAELIAAALIVLGVAELHYFAVPFLGPDWIGPSQGLGVVAFALLLAGMVVEELNERRWLASVAALAERRRVARDLHDGLAQDLAFIAAHGALIDRSLGAEHPVAFAARRALDIARDTISELSVSHEVSARDALEAVALEQRKRFGIVVDVDAPADAELSPAVREDVLRIAREAIANAARHGRAKTVVVSLIRREGGRELLRVRDDGCGIPGGDSGAMPEGFGLRSMRDRAAGFGGGLRIRRGNGCGTELELTLP